MKLSNEEIAAKDLRVGNYLNKDGIIVKIDARSIFDIAYNAIDTIKYKPIPITPEILVRCGFVKDANILTNSFSITLPSLPRQFKSLSIAWSNDSPKHKWYAFFRDGDKEKPREQDAVVCLMRNMNYLHQLQNLYYALTGEELDLGIAISKNEVK